MQNNDAKEARRWAAEQAKKRTNAKYPPAWYQNKYWQQAILIIVGVGVTVYQLWVGWANISYWFIGLGMVAFIGGWVADILTTKKAFHYLPEYQKRGEPYPLIESNPFLSDYPSLDEQLLSLSSLIKLTIFLLTPVLPALGWGGAWSGFSAALNNQRNTDSVRFQLQQYDLLVKSFEKKRRDTRGNLVLRPD